MQCYPPWESRKLRLFITYRWLPNQLSRYPCTCGWDSLSIHGTPARPLHDIQRSGNVELRSQLLGCTSSHLP
jgi:hypothetical protein